MVEKSQDWLKKIKGLLPNMLEYWIYCLNCRYNVTFTATLTFKDTNGSETLSTVHKNCDPFAIC